MNKQLLHINVSAKSKFGILDKNTEKWFNPLKSEMLKEFEVGKAYSVELEDTTAANGKTYTNIVSITGRETPTAVAAAGVTTAEVKTPYVKKDYSKFKPREVKATLSKEEWAAKDRSQLVGGLSHDAATLVAAAVTSGVPVEQVIEKFKVVLAGLIKARDEVK